MPKRWCGWLLLLCCLVAGCDRSGSYVDLNGNAISLRHFSGERVVLNYWASWCLPCVAEINELNAFHQEFHAQGISVIGVNRDVLARDELMALATRLNITFPVLTDDPAPYLGITDVVTLPTTFILDKRGKILYELHGKLSRELLMNIIGLQKT